MLHWVTHGLTDGGSEHLEAEVKLKKKNKKIKLRDL